MNGYFRSPIVKHVFIGIMLLVFSLLLTGCWDRVEINDIGIVVATGMDKTDDDLIELSIQLMKPGSMSGGGQQGSSMGQGGSQTMIVKAKGKTIYDARSKLQEKVSRRLFWGHNLIVVIGRKLAEEGIQKHIDFFARHPFPRLRAFVYVANGKAINILKVPPSLEQSTAESIRELANRKTESGVTIKELLQMLSNETGASVLPLIHITKDPLGEKNIKMSDIAVFKNTKMIAKLDEDMARGLMWIRDEVESASVTIKPKNADGLISFNIFNAQTTLIPEIKNGNWKITIKIKAEDDAVDNESKLNLMDPQIIDEIQDQLAEIINQRIQLTLDKIQKDLKADIFKFGVVFHRHFPEQWKQNKNNWDTTFSKIEVKLQTTVDIERPGMSNKPQGVEKDEVINK